MIFYFSGTGNSSGIARMLAERLGDVAVSIIDTDPSEFKFSSEDRVGFVFPIYAYVAPKVMLEFASRIVTNGAYTFAVPTFSNAVGFGLEHFSQNACHLDAGYSILMPDNMPVFDKVVETRESAIKKLKLAIPRFESIYEKVRDKICEFDIHYGPTPEKVTYEIGVKFLEKTRFTTTAYHVKNELCIGCGLCSGKCPVKVIKMVDNRPVWTKETCYVCMACLNHCPTQALQYGQFSEGKYRYVFKGFDLSKY